MSKNSNSHVKPLDIRLDRWLWAARFFKTRALAKQAIDGGKVHINGQRAKPARAVRLDETLSIRRGYDIFTVVVAGLSDKRGPSKVAVELYNETEESVTLRKKEAELRRVAELSVSTPAHRPDKRQRRKIHQFKQSQS
ncbi:MAG: ribosome-associated heat shock protein Hsp15 [Enterobacterales bacterium]|jgi:ribosome-associated heat shock protein Hsp15